MSCSKPPQLHEVVKPLAWLLGKWRSEHGRGMYPTMKNFTYGEEVEFSHIGQPNLQYRAYSWMGDHDTPMHREIGYVRLQPGSLHVAFIIAHNTGLSEVEEGEVNGTTIKLESKGISRLSFGSEPSVKKIVRTFRMKEEDVLEQVMYMETSRTPLTEHLRIQYKKQKHHAWEDNVFYTAY
ncbi:THAP domain-containing protein 4 isoform X1 [Lingula anatina]|uniref:THAP domain-containing protein 4 isoform X1 n=1 Tax=Lingula anatina TaxID=7574 RepID=A0A1S3I2B4_LINAN|nr:THAP domain-containing protein 4 isoform X1 [Lingula anatina]XP_013392421.1 THAP domain-containing protein 4 isoform X1 [Lingula anatina]|eukprot:XP_013392405.1 THAP domain-containing protein 4 isoform X1 [Lingula anatina]